MVDNKLFESILRQEIREYVSAYFAGGREPLPNKTVLVAAKVGQNGLERDFTTHTFTSKLVNLEVGDVVAFDRPSDVDPKIHRLRLYALAKYVKKKTGFTYAYKHDDNRTLMKRAY